MTGGGSFAIYQLIDREHAKKNGTYGTDMHKARELEKIEIKAKQFIHKTLTGAH